MGLPVWPAITSWRSDMDLSARAPRPDIIYMSRRIRPRGASSATMPTRADEAAPAVRTNVSTSPVPPSGLSLEGPRAGTPAYAGKASRAPLLAPVRDSARLFTAPGFTEIRQMTESTPIARLNARQSGIGTMMVHAARSAAWEDIDGVTGAENAQGELAGVASHTTGNRKLVAFHDGSAAISLRHVRRLRRAIVIAQDEPLVVSLFGDAALAVSPRSPEGKSLVLYVSRIDNLLELRAEYVEAGNDEAMWYAFGFTMTTPTHLHTGRR